jgi:uracil DNA glycosylase
MNTKSKAEALSEKEIDEIVVAQADDASAWEEPIHVHKTNVSSVPLPSELASRAAFFARLHREASVEDWLTRVIKERIDLEEAAFAELKRDLTAKNNT